MVYCQTTYYNYRYICISNFSVKKLKERKTKIKTSETVWNDNCKQFNLSQSSWKLNIRKSLKIQAQITVAVLFYIF